MKLSVLLVVLAFGACHGVRVQVSNSLTSDAGDGVAVYKATDMQHRLTTAMIRVNRIVRKISNKVPGLANWTLTQWRKAVVYVKNKAKDLKESSSTILAPLADRTILAAQKLEGQISKLIVDSKYRQEVFDEVENMPFQDEVKMVESGYDDNSEEQEMVDSTAAARINKEMGAVNRGAALLGIGALVMDRLKPRQLIKKALDFLRKRWRENRRNRVSKNSKDHEEQEIEDIEDDLAKQDDEDDDGDMEEATESIEDELAKQDGEEDEDDKEQGLPSEDELQKQVEDELHDDEP